MDHLLSARSCLVILLAGALLTPNCATIMQRSTWQKIPVTSAPVGATVSVNGDKQGVTPLDLTLFRKKKGQVIRIESPGYNPFEIRLKRSLSSGPVAGNIVIGLPIGLLTAGIYGLTHHTASNAIGALTTLAIGGLLIGVDTGGAGYELSPSELTVTLTKADGTPRVATLFIDADDFRNVTWIRVRGN